jgi:DNA processing protein
MGDMSLLEKPSVAIVGARNASAAACRFARGLAHDLGRDGVMVVSGLARGIDAAAHEGGLGTGTIGVIAGGLDIFYPPENERLQRAMGERGLVLAEMPPGTEPRARHFPYRNRIIAGLCPATLVVEAAPKSGSLITARLAAEMGREVLAVPGSPLDPRAQGCNGLIRDGATLVQNAGEVLEALRPGLGGVR